MKLEEMMMMMTISKSPEENLRIESVTNDPITTSTTTFPTWKLYENPFYTNSSAPHYPSQNQIHQTQNQQQQQQNQCEGNKSSVNHQPKQIHRLQLPISTRKIAASFWDLTFIKPFMESELEVARAKIMELKAELERERKARKKAESMNKKLVRELSEVKKGRESLEQLCEELAREISSDKAEMDRMQKDMEEERKMLRVAEVLREERVQMKLADAKILLEEKLQELESESSKCSQTEEPESKNVKHSMPTKAATNRGTNTNHHHSSSSGDETKSCVLAEKSTCDNNDTDMNIGFGSIPTCLSQRRASPEPENPHIKRGIKGFVEFPKVVRAIGSKSRHLGTKLECQKAQLRILLKQKSPIPSTNLITN